MKPSRSETGACGLSAALFLLLAARPSHAQSFTDVREVSSTGEAAAFLLVPIGARSVGLGGAVTARRADAEGALTNPASLAGLERGTLYYHRSNDFGAVNQVFGGVWITPAAVVGVAFQDFDFGSIQATDARAQPLGTLDVGNQALVLTAARTVLEPLEVGVSYKLIRLASDCSGACAQFDFSGTAHAFDVGAVLSVPGIAGLDVGAVVRNAGTNLSAGGGPSDPLPTRLRIGAALDLLPHLSLGPELAEDLDVRIMADVQEPVSEFDDLDAAVGAQLGYRDTFYLRAGYAWQGEGRTGPALGIGFATARFNLDLGRAFDDFASFDSDESFQLSLGVRL